MFWLGFKVIVQHSGWDVFLVDAKSEQAIRKLWDQEGDSEFGESVNSEDSERYIAEIQEVEP